MNHATDLPRTWPAKRCQMPWVPGCPRRIQKFKSNQETTALGHEGRVESRSTSSNISNSGCIDACDCTFSTRLSSTLPKLLQLPLNWLLLKSVHKPAHIRMKKQSQTWEESKTWGSPHWSNGAVMDSVPPDIGNDRTVWNKEELKVLIPVGPIELWATCYTLINVRWFKKRINLLMPLSPYRFFFLIVLQAICTYHWMWFPSLGRTSMARWSMGHGVWRWLSG